ncbi:uncharacterized protein LOC143254442 [Tachypleus tridentatus]|uniref:uncharacterized protein LOC143254442 n=1 Tax=Tachypleus tridentatus TaxID=6853 RepID=UPI003FCF3A2B
MLPSVKMLICEEFMITCSTNMSLFLKERTPTDLGEMINLAEQYMESQGGSITGKLKDNQFKSKQVMDEYYQDSTWARYVLIDGMVRKLPIARIQVDTPY